MVLVGQRSSWSPVFDWVRRLENLGFDSVWVPDHPMTGIDSWATLSAIAARGTSLRLGPLVSCISYRNPALLARLAADVDCLSDGRLVLGLGIGNNEPEYQHMGLTMPTTRERQQALVETIEIVRGMWGDQPFSYEGEHFRVADAVVRAPVQQPHVPVLIAGGGERVTLRQVAQYADVVNFGPTSHTGGATGSEAIRRKCDVLRDHCQSFGRPYESVLRSYIVWAIATAKSDDLEMKMSRVAPHLTRRARENMFTGTAQEMVPYCQGLVDAGMRYIILAIDVDDLETAELVGTQVIPRFA
jgi:alkanesulfonate monooxygenase SsuD/methylene tetrahydromethanopterin reductase-like flavin-dependent oxidoreductase (luciferase family)